jgi:PTS system nitrogen regulatory IIA component
MQLTVRDAADLLEIAEEEIYRFIRDRSIPFYEVHDQVRFNRAELLAWATSNGRPVSADVIHKLSSAQDGLADSLLAGGIHRHVDAHDHPSIVRAIVDRLPLKDAAEREFVASVLTSTSPSRSTVGDGVAIPHAKSPIIEQGSRSSITLCFLERPIDLGAIDKKPVTTVFMIVAPTPKVHLQILSRLSTALLDAGLRTAIQAQASDEVILSEARRIDGAIAARHPSSPRIDHG